METTENTVHITRISGPVVYGHTASLCDKTGWCRGVTETAYPNIYAGAVEIGRKYALDADGHVAGEARFSSTCPRPGFLRLAVEAEEASGHRRGWWKRVTRVDSTKKNGFAFEGEFLSSGVQEDLPVGAILVENRPRGFVKGGWEEGVAFRVTEQGLVEVARCNHWRKEFLNFRDTIAALLP